MSGWEDHGHHGGLVLHFPGEERMLIQALVPARSEGSRGAVTEVLLAVLAAVPWAGAQRAGGSRVGLQF